MCRTICTDARKYDVFTSVELNINGFCSQRDPSSSFNHRVKAESCRRQLGCVPRTCPKPFTDMEWTRYFESRSNISSHRTDHNLVLCTVCLIISLNHLDPYFYWCDMLGKGCFIQPLPYKLFSRRPVWYRRDQAHRIQILQVVPTRDVCYKVQPRTM